MATKNNPGAFDCYEKADPDEPMFVLLARDASAPAMVRAWVSHRIKIGKNHPDDAQLTEALSCAREMEEWREEDRG